MMQKSISEAAREACQVVGIKYKSTQINDKFYVTDAIDGKKGNGAGRIKLFADGKGGIVQNWKTGHKHAFFTNQTSPQAITPAEQERIKREQARREAQQASRQNQAAKKAQSLWQSAQPAPVDHPYLIRKQIKPHCARVANWQRVIDKAGNKCTITIENALIVPLYGMAGTLCSIQAIFPQKHPDFERDKDFLPGGGLSGLFCWIGGKSETVLVCEGFATGVSLHEETRCRVYVAFTANNLLAVARIIREKLPNAAIVLCADNDATPGNPGLTKATEAAIAIGATLAVPPIWGDFNDYSIYLKGGANGN